MEILGANGQPVPSMVKIRAKFERFEISSFYVGKTASPVEPDNTNHHNVKIKNTQLNKWVTLDYWTANGRIDSPKDLMFAFKSLITASPMGAMPQDAFCVAMGIDKFTNKERLMYQHCMEVNAKLAPLLQDVSVRDMVLSLNKLGVKR